ncbi:PqiB family protein [Pseudogemmobacter sp. W21_MBD1_M6]|uniref:PqiB family protein n=1 Tax=Pseudogemmobacter sp. W21_MBD1_M6 TaxID=3240271 RepID=UPI003F95BB39
MSDPADLAISTKSRPLWARLSVVWLVPLLALVISMFVAWQSYSDRGVAITIQFENGAGVEAGKTRLKYRDVEIGMVESVSFSNDIKHVIVTARVDETVVPYMDEDAQFWIARPRVTAQGISGLDTVLAGAYIEGSWNAEAGRPMTVFTGVEIPPLVRPGAKGKQIKLRAPTGGSISVGSPILYRGVKVGQIETVNLSELGDSVVVDAFVDAPYDRLISTASRFWNLSGFSLKLDTSGVSLDVNSLASLVQGGLGFDTVYSGGFAISEKQVFDIFDDEETARASIFNRRLAAATRLSIIFEGNVRGLNAGSAVEFGGVRVGEVDSITTSVEDVVDGALADVRLLVNIVIDPSRLGLPSGTSPQATVEFLQANVAQGLRARIASANLLGTSLVVELVQLDDVAPVDMDVSLERAPYPILPSIASNVSDFTATAEGVLNRINELPIEELMGSAIDLMDNVSRIAASEGMKEAPDAVVALLNDTRTLVNSDDVKAIPAELRAISEQVRGMMATIEAGGAAESLLSALNEADAAAKTVNAATQALPDLVAQLDKLATTAAGLPLEQLMTSTRGLIETADSVIGTEAAKELPAALNGALDRVRSFLGTLEDGGAVDNLNTALSSAASASDAVATAVADLPALTNRLNALATQAGNTLSGYDDNSAFSRETRDAIRQIKEAAAAFASLSRAIERRPNSLITGR